MAASDSFTLTKKTYMYTCCVKFYAHAYLRTRRYAPDVGTYQAVDRISRKKHDFSTLNK